jgi:hypothetical protein
MSISEQKDKQIVVGWANGILLTNKKEWNAECGGTHL